MSICEKCDKDSLKALRHVCRRISRISFKVQYEQLSYFIWPNGKLDLGMEHVMREAQLKDGVGHLRIQAYMPTLEDQHVSSDLVIGCECSRLILTYSICCDPLLAASHSARASITSTISKSSRSSSPWKSSCRNGGQQTSSHVPITTCRSIYSELHYPLSSPLASPPTRLQSPPKSRVSL